MDGWIRVFFEREEQAYPQNVEQNEYPATLKFEIVSH